MKIKLIQNIIVIFIGILLCISGCEDTPNNPIPNEAPNTFIALFPDSTITQQRSQLHVHWWADDPDGIVIGYYFKWEGINNDWEFTTSNDSVFSLPIGTADTNYTFKIMAVDNNGNGKYDTNISRNNINLGDEPFIDSNENGGFDDGEYYYDIGNVDSTPDEMNFPIKNSAPEIVWTEDSTLPLQSFPVMTLGWHAFDLDGDESIVSINLSLNDTSSFVTLDGGVRLITIRIKDINAVNPEMEILINGSEQRIHNELLSNLKLDDNNRIYLRASDISGASSPFVPLPDTSREWYVKKPKGEILVFDDYDTGDNAAIFYEEKFNSIFGGSYSDRFDVYDLENESLPYPNITILQTLKLFDFCYWYSDFSPSLPYINLVTQDYIESGGKIAYSLTFVDSSDAFNFSLPILQNFLPIDDVSEPLVFMITGADVIPIGGTDFPQLKTSSTVGFVRTFTANPSSAIELYDLSSSQISGTIGFMDVSKDLFFIGLPLHQCEAIPGTVNSLLEKILTELGIAK